MEGFSKRVKPDEMMTDEQKQKASAAGTSGRRKRAA
jgi:hypothetical protein